MLTKAYREAYKLKLKHENTSLWLQGLYIYEALCDVSPVLHAFAKPRTKPQEYLKEPIALTKEEVRERRERDELKAYRDAIEQMRTWAISQNGKRKSEPQGK